MTTRVEKTVTVKVPLSTAYNQWTQFEQFPQFMDGVESVTQLEDDRLEWVAEIGGVRRQWLARILEQVPDQKVAWAAVEGATNSGEVTFADAGEGRTSVHLTLEFEPEGLLETLGDKLGLVEDQAERDLEHFRRFIEAEAGETGAWRGVVVEDEADGEGYTPAAAAGATPHLAAPSGSHDGGLTPGDDIEDVQLAGPADLGPTTNPAMEGRIKRDDIVGRDDPRS